MYFFLIIFILLMHILLFLISWFYVFVNIFELLNDVLEFYDFLDVQILKVFSLNNKFQR